MNILAFMIALQVLLILVCTISDAADPLQEQYGILKHASILYRHGDRSPLSTYPRDPLKDYPWLDGYGQLQNKGKRRLVKVGKWFRTRYQDFINDTYTRHEIRTDSSSIDRCVMSALCFLYGFYPAMGMQIWVPNETWQPIPVYAIPRYDDNKLLLSKPCTLRDIFAEREDTDPKYADTYNKYKTIIDNITKETGIDAQHMSKAKLFARLDQLFDTFTVYRQNDLPLPLWAENLDSLNTILALTTRKHIFNLQLTRLNSGPFLGSVVADMYRKLADTKYEQKLHVYSAHDSTLWTVMRALDIYDHVQPAYGASLMFELREKNSTNYVTISYRNETSESEARLLFVPGCGLTCTFKRFRELTNPLIPEDWDAECESSVLSSFIVLTIVLSATVHLVYKAKRLIRLMLERSKSANSGLSPVSNKVPGAVQKQ